VAELLSGVGRDGGEGHCLAYYSYKDVEKLEKFMSGKPLQSKNWICFVGSGGLCRNFDV
jgi:hypothetical protein